MERAGDGFIMRPLLEEASVAQSSRVSMIGETSGAVHEADASESLALMASSTSLATHSEVFRCASRTEVDLGEDDFEDAAPQSAAAAPAAAPLPRASFRRVDALKGSKGRPPAHGRDRCELERRASATTDIEMQDIALPSPRTRGGRECFICLIEGDLDAPLVRCCNTCYASTHLRCWREWRQNQRLTSLRSRLLGQRMPTNLLLCTICKSGTAMIAGEESGLRWMDDMLRRSQQGNSARNVQQFLGNLGRDDSDDQLEDLVYASRLGVCALISYLGLLVAVLVLACMLIVTHHFYAGDVVLCCFIAVYEVTVFHIVLLAIVRRRSFLLAAAASDALEDSPPGQVPSVTPEVATSGPDRPPRFFSSPSRSRPMPADGADGGTRVSVLSFGGGAARETSTETLQGARRALAAMFALRRVADPIGGATALLAAADP